MQAAAGAQAERSNAIAPAAMSARADGDCAMPFALNFFHDQVAAGGASAPALPAAHRLLYVRHGVVVINGVTFADEAAYCEAPVELQSAADWSQVWRWELALPNAAPLLLDGNGVLSSLRMSRVVTHLAMLD